MSVCVDTTVCTWCWLHSGQLCAGFQRFAVYIHTCTLWIEVMEWVELWQHSGTTSGDFWSLGWWGTRKSPSCYSCVSSAWCGGLPSCRGSGCCSQEQHCSRMSGEVLPTSPVQWARLQHPHYPHSSKGRLERSVTSHKRLYRLVCRSVSRGPLYLSASSSVMKRPSAGRVSRFPAAGISSSSHQDFN